MKGGERRHTGGVVVAKVHLFAVLANVVLWIRKVGKGEKGKRGHTMRQTQLQPPRDVRCSIC